MSGDLQPHGVHPGDPYELLKALNDDVRVTRPPARVLADIVRSIGIEHLVPIAPPPQEVLPRWRRTVQGLRHSRTRDAEAIHHHYDVSNTFYEWVLGPSMTYTCACYPHTDATLEEAQANKYRLVFDKLRLKTGDRLLDVGRIAVHRTGPPGHHAAAHSETSERRGLTLDGRHRRAARRRLLPLSRSAGNLRTRRRSRVH